MGKKRRGKCYSGRRKIIPRKGSFQFSCHGDKHMSPEEHELLRLLEILDDISGAPSSNVKEIVISALKDDATLFRDFLQTKDENWLSKHRQIETKENSIANSVHEEGGGDHSKIEDDIADSASPSVDSDTKKLPWEEAGRLEKSSEEHLEEADEGAQAAELKSQIQHPPDSVQHVDQPSPTDDHQQASHQPIYPIQRVLAPSPQVITKIQQVLVSSVVSATRTDQLEEVLSVVRYNRIILYLYKLLAQRFRKQAKERRRKQMIRLQHAVDRRCVLQQHSAGSLILQFGQSADVGAVIPTQRYLPGFPLSPQDAPPRDFLLNIQWERRSLQILHEILRSPRISEYQQVISNILRSTPNLGSKLQAVMATQAQQHAKLLANGQRRPQSGGGRRRGRHRIGDSQDEHYLERNGYQLAPHAFMKLNTKYPDSVWVSKRARVEEGEPSFQAGNKGVFQGRPALPASGSYQGMKKENGSDVESGRGLYIASYSGGGVLHERAPVPAISILSPPQSPGLKVRDHPDHYLSEMWRACEGLGLPVPSGCHQPPPSAANHLHSLP